MFESTKSSCVRAVCESMVERDSKSSLAWVASEFAATCKQTSPVTKATPPDVLAGAFPLRGAPLGFPQAVGACLARATPEEEDAWCAGLFFRGACIRTFCFGRSLLNLGSGCQAICGRRRRWLVWSWLLWWFALSTWMGGPTYKHLGFVSKLKKNL